MTGDVLSRSSSMATTQLFSKNTSSPSENSTRRSYLPKGSKASKCDGSARNGRWTLTEHLRFLEALKLHGKNWKLIEDHIGTRTST